MADHDWAEWAGWVHGALSSAVYFLWFWIVYVATVSNSQPRVTTVACLERPVEETIEGYVSRATNTSSHATHPYVTSGTPEVAVNYRLFVYAFQKSKFAT